MPARSLFCLLLALVLVAALALGCSDDGGGGGGGGGEGAEIYRESCSSCHGADGNGFVGPDLHGIAERRTLEEHIEVVENGIPPQMPAWKELGADKVRAVVEYEREAFG
jgi:mono/diheme cytochrome c family protein